MSGIAAEASLEELVDNLRKRVILLENQGEDMGHELQAAVAGVAALARGESLEGIPKADVMRDALWCCPACGHRLGVYNSQEDVLRIRYKDLFVWVHAGTGGFIEVVCRSCGERVRAADTETK